MDALVFLDELVLLAVLAVSGAALVDGLAASIALGVLLPLGAALVWGRWFAPHASHPLPRLHRTAGKVGLVAVASVLLAVAGHPWWAVAFLVVSAALLAGGEVAASRPSSGPDF